MKLTYVLPFFIFICVGLILWRGLGLHPNLIPSPLIGKPAPTFRLPTLADSQEMTTEKDFQGHVTLVNVWATWCEACVEENDFLVSLSKQDKKLMIYGIDYKDNPKAAQRYLAEKGNPYAIVAVDQQGDVAIDWGVYGTPETFVIDKQGIIRYKQIGTITRMAWADTIEPLLQQLEDQP